MGSLTTTSKGIRLQDLGTKILRQGDNDSKHIWGGRPWPTLTGTPVKDLQTALIAVGTLTSPADGHFGVHTEQALRRFQWYDINLRYRLKVSKGTQIGSGIIWRYPPSGIRIPGSCDAVTASAIIAWQADNYMTTSPLVRLNVDLLSNVELGESFRSLSYPSASDGEILVHSNFACVISGAMNDAAKKANVVLSINQTFRRHNIPPSGAVVPPATKSQHLVGHAVDLNIVDGETVNTTSMFSAGNQTDNADKFIAAAKGEGLRWGGDFNDADPPHFDDYLNPNSEDYNMTYFFAQHCFEKQHPMSLVSK